MAPPSTGIIAHRAGDAGRGGGEHERLAGPSSLASVFTILGRTREQPIGNGQLRERPVHRGASMKTVEATAPAREPGTCRGGSGCASERPPLWVLLPIVAVTGRAP